MSDPIAQRIKSITRGQERACAAGHCRPEWPFAHQYVSLRRSPAAGAACIIRHTRGRLERGLRWDVTKYQIENDLDTVVHLSVCPQQVLNEIKVCSSPLESAVTPDGATMLVTCYNNTVAWIDTATDRVTFTLPLPNSFPAGIAISPDGTRAYVSNYFDSNPPPRSW